MTAESPPVRAMLLDMGEQVMWLPCPGKAWVRKGKCGHVDLIATGLWVRASGALEVSVGLLSLLCDQLSFKSRIFREKMEAGQEHQEWPGSV